MSVPCGICGQPTRFTSIKRCDRCYELESRILRSMGLAQGVIAAAGSTRTARSREGAGRPELQLAVLPHQKDRLRYARSNG
jgi:hypothetical protein